MLKQQYAGNEAGLTLVELLAAMVILVFGAVAALSILVEAQKANNLAKAKTMAVNEAEAQLERIFMDPNPASVAATYNGLTFGVNNLVGNGPNGDAGLITVDGNDPHQVRVTVTWNGQGTLPSGTVSITAFRSGVER